MSAQRWTTDLDDDCERCGRRTLHEVTLEMRTESKRRENAEFSREPYRVATCRICDTETTRRMNNA